MGNMIGSMEDEYNSLRYNHLRPKNVTNTAAGRYSTPVLNNRKESKGKNKLEEKEKAGDINAKIYREIFPPPNNEKSTRNTMTSIFYKDNTKNDDTEEENKHGEIKQENEKEEEIEEIIKNELNNESNVNLTYTNTEEDIIFTKTEENVDENTNENTNENINENTNEIVSKRKRSNEFELKFVKSGEDIRKSYIAKLIYKKIWQPLIKEKDHNSLIIFDWDDTLLCTSFLTPNGIFLEDTRIIDKDFEKLKKLELSAANILKQAINKGDTYIITNAAPGWVEYSASRFYPEVAKLLNKITIVSARGEYEKKFPGDSRQWKILAFLETLKNLDTNLVTNLICLGDSVIEMEAAHILASKFSQAYIKTIKFREAPKPEELYKQLGLVIDQFSKIFSAVKNLTIRVEKKSKEESNPNPITNSNAKK